MVVIVALFVLMLTPLARADADPGQFAAEYGRFSTSVFPNSSSRR